jgi:hypothetical protein
MSQKRTALTIPEPENNTAILGEEYLSREAVLKAVRKHPRSWYRLEARGDGPPRTVIGKTVFYRRSSFVEWLRSREEHNGVRLSANGRPRKPPARVGSSASSAPSISRTRNARRARRAA